MNLPHSDSRMRRTNSRRQLSQRLLVVAGDEITHTRQELGTNLIWVRARQWPLVGRRLVQLGFENFSQVGSNATAAFRRRRTLRSAGQRH